MSKNTSSKLVKVLSLDGGGIRGILTARILANLEQKINNRGGEQRNIGQRFDLIAGTSAGGIIALALAAGASAKDILKFYQESIIDIFPIEGKVKSTWRRANWLFKPKFRAYLLKEKIEAFYGKIGAEKKTLGDLNKPDVCIASVDLSGAKLRLHKSAYFDRNKGRVGEKLVEIAFASAAAPTYFSPQKALENSGTLIDGGICANNPSMVALVDALQISRYNLKEKNRSVDRFENILLLSIGTGKMGCMPYDPKKLEKNGVFGWMYSGGSSPLLELVMESQSDMIHEQLGFILGPNNYFRINPILRTPMALDDASNVDYLKSLSDIRLDMENKVIGSL